MSLESQVAALVSAASNLTSQVAGKMSQIDQKVDKATQAVPEAVNSLATRTIYVDVINGDNNNIGSSDSPKRTLRGALNDQPDLGTVIVNLKSPGNYQLDGDVSIGNKNVFIVGSATNKAGYVISPVAYLDPDGSAIWSTQFVLGFTGSVRISGATLKTLTLDASYSGGYTSSFRTSMFTTIGANAIISLQHIDLEINHGPMTHQHSEGSFGKADIQFRSVAVQKKPLLELPELARHYVVDHYGSSQIPYSYYATTSSLQGFADWSETVSFLNPLITSNVV